MDSLNTKQSPELRPGSQALGSSSAGEKEPAPSSARWASSLLRLVIAFLFILSLTGFALYFLVPFLENPQALADFHLYLGVLFLPFYFWYQAKHYVRVRAFAGTLIYRLGYSSFACMLVLIVSGLLLPFLEEARWLSILHLLSGAALTIVLPAHFSVLLFRLSRSKAWGEVRFRREILWTLLLLPICTFLASMFFFVLV